MTYTPFYFAWVDPDQAVFDPATMSRVDEHIIKLEMKQDEGQYATCEVTIKNPRVGLLNPSRKVWAWIARNPIDTAGVSPADPVPLFFGVLVSIPSDLFAELIQLKFIARPSDYIERRQAVAETLRVAPFYDEIWLETSKRDDPDAILEGYSSLWHTDRITHATTVSDILQGEDGVAVFDEDTVFYDSLHMGIGDAPLDTVRVEAGCVWTQRCFGFVKGPGAFLNTYTGETFMEEWPKPGQNIGGGWSCEASFVVDTWAIKLTPMAKYESNMKLIDPKMLDCSVTSAHASGTYPALQMTGSSSDETGNLAATLTWLNSIGLCWPSQGILKNPSSHSNGMVIPLWNLQCDWIARYDAKREFSEEIALDVSAAVQKVFTSPDLKQRTEVMKLSNVNVGEPQLDPMAWSDFAGQLVPVGTIIYPNDPTKPGGTSWQICVGGLGTAGNTQPSFSSTYGQITNDGTVRWYSLGRRRPANFVIQPWSAFAGQSVPPGTVVQGSNPVTTYQYALRVEGTAGTVEPDFSDIPGTRTIDGSAVWASMGQSPLTNQPDWSEATPIATGEVIGYAQRAFDNNTGKMELTGGFAFLIATQGGVTNSMQAEQDWTPPITDTDEVAPIERAYYYYAGPADDPGEKPDFESASDPELPIPGALNFDWQTPGAIVYEQGTGSVVWMSLGPNPPVLPIPIGGTPINVTGRCYFPTSRGKLSVQYMIARARARLRHRSRCVNISFQVPFDAGLSLSCRMNAQITDPRLPGSTVNGKIKSYTLSSSGGKEFCHIEIGCAVGEGGTPATSDGTPEYVSAGYVQAGYQAYDGVSLALGSGDISYTPPTFVPFDDGLSFPLFRMPAVAHLNATSRDQLSALQGGIAVAKAEATLPQIIGRTAAFSTPAAQAWTLELAQHKMAGHSIAQVMESHPVTWECTIHPVQGQTFFGAYHVSVSQLEIPMGVDLSAPSSP